MGCSDPVKLDSENGADRPDTKAVDVVVVGSSGGSVKNRIDPL